MIRIAICENGIQEGLRLRSVVDSCAAAAGIGNIEIAVLDSYADLATLVKRLREAYFDVVLCRVEANSAPDTSASPAAFLGDLVLLAPTTTFVLMSSDADNAICAYDAGAKFIQTPFTQESFRRVVLEAVESARLQHRRSFSVKSTKSVVNMDLSEITFVETNKKGLIIHLPGSRTVSTRGTLAALHERLAAADERFVRAGGSFIINLDNIRSTGGSAVVFGDGDTIILPVRARKALQDAFTSYRLR